MSQEEILSELKKIREVLEKTPPAAPVPRGLWNEFKDFLSKYKVFGLAVAFIVALYVGTLVQSVVQNLLLPLIGLVIPGMDNLVTFSVGVFGVGQFLVALLTFLIVAFLVFLVVKVAKRWNLE
ncbi:MAG: MscL family protein [Nitrososphaerota archaeon]|nr:MscL family protein [Nitrososphaerota archaeon]